MPSGNYHESVLRQQPEAHLELRIQGWALEYLQGGMQKLATPLVLSSVCSLVKYRSIETMHLSRPAAAYAK